MDKNTPIFDKDDLADTLALEFGKTKTEMKSLVEATIRAIGENLKAGTEVSLFGLGIFKIIPTAEKKGRIILTGEPAVFPASHKIKFSAAKPIKAAVKAL